jgi:DNA-directed RNA polymerase specialized sigma24 family protein
MRHVDGYSLAEISKLLDIGLETIKKRYYRALKRFKDLVA